MNPGHHIARVERLIEQAGRWCPDADAPSKREAARRLAFETAHARGLAEVWDLEPVPGIPSPHARELLDAALQIQTSAPAWTWPNSEAPLHPSGFGWGPDNSCATCAWFQDGICVQMKSTEGEPVAWSADTRACLRWESRSHVEDCLACGACCREGYSFAPVEPDEDLARLRPDLLRPSPAGGGRLDRPDGLCVALDRSAKDKFPCLVYPMRPRACAELAPGSLACLVARRRTGLSR